MTKINLNRFLLTPDIKEEFIVSHILLNAHAFLVKHCGPENHRRLPYMLITGSTVLKNFYPSFRTEQNDIDIIITVEPSFIKFYDFLSFIIDSVNRNFNSTKSIYTTYRVGKNRFIVENIVKNNKKVLEFILCPQGYENPSLFISPQEMNYGQLYTEIIGLSVLEDDTSINILQLGIHNPGCILTTKINYIFSAINKLNTVIQQITIHKDKPRVLINQIIKDSFQKSYVTYDNISEESSYEEIIQSIVNGVDKHKNDLVKLLEISFTNFTFPPDFIISNVTAESTSRVKGKLILLDDDDDDDFFEEVGENNQPENEQQQNVEF